MQSLTQPQFRELLRRTGQFAPWSEFRRALLDANIPRKAASARARKAFLGCDKPDWKPPKIETELAGYSLVDPKVWVGRDKVSTRQEAEWVSRHINVKVGPKDAPSPTAWNLLRWVRQAPENETTFWRSIFLKLLPTQQQLQQADRFKERNTELDDLIVVLEKAGGHVDSGDDGVAAVGVRGESEAAELPVGFSVGSAGRLGKVSVSVGSGDQGSA